MARKRIAAAAKATPKPNESNAKKRAICLGGGGPAAGLHIGALEQLTGKSDANGQPIRFDIWALSCIGAWVGVIYNQAKNGEGLATLNEFFRDVFREDKSFQSFPTNTIFAPDWAGNAEAMLNFLWDPGNYRNAFLPREMMKSFLYSMSSLRRMSASRRNGEPEVFCEGDFNRWALNHVLAVHPGVRFLTALLYKSAIDGRARLHYRDSSFLKDINFKNLDAEGKPYIFFNAFNFDTKKLDLFANNPPERPRDSDHKAISAESLCACSALPFVEQTVKVGSHTYCEGALVDTVNFFDLLDDHKDDLAEIWINRIVDAHQIRQPQNLYDAFANLCQLFAATVGADDVKLFKHKVRENNRKGNKLKWTGTIVEIQVDDQIDFHWSHKNLNDGRDRGARAAENAYKLYMLYKDMNKADDDVTIIPDDLNNKQIEAAGVPLPRKRLRPDWDV